jgi:two-component system NtrC family sensor kinase
LRGAERIKGLAQSLLAFSRPSKEELLPLGPNEVIERSLELCHYQVLKGGVRLERSLAPGLPRIMGVSNQIEMALINLVVNAIQAMEGGGVLRVTSRLQGDEVEILVSDTGPGIPDDVQGQIFEPFFTTKPEGRGTGLGLSTVLMVVERHRGKVDFAASRGAPVRLSFPTAQSPGRSRPRPERRRRSSAMAQRRSARCLGRIPAPCVVRSRALAAPSPRRDCA